MEKVQMKRLLHFFELNCLFKSLHTQLAQTNKTLQNNLTFKLEPLFQHWRKLIEKS